MNINDAIRNRRSIRKFTPYPVHHNIIREIVDTCRWTGSFLNTQPWELAILNGDVMEELKKRLKEHFDSGKPVEREYFVAPPESEPYKNRAENFRAGIDNLMFPAGIKDLEEAKRDYTYSGIVVRDAPNAIVIYTEKDMFESPLHIMALGMMVQSICLSAMEYNLGTCVMGRPVETPDIFRELLFIPDNKIIMCIIAIGFSDEKAKINHLPRRRATEEELVRWYGF